MSEQKDKRVPLEHIISAVGSSDIDIVKFIEPSDYPDGNNSVQVRDHIKHDSRQFTDSVYLDEFTWREIGKRMGWKMPD